MVDIATPAVGARVRPSPKTPVADDETFRVAEELMLLSASRSRGAPVGGEGASTRKDPRAPTDETAQQLRRRQKALTAQFELLMSPTSSESSQTSQTRRRSTPTELEDLINSRVDVSHSQLLNEHRTQFRRARRRWTTQRANRQKAVLAKFKVQGIPLVEHLASLR